MRQFIERQPNRLNEVVQYKTTYHNARNKCENNIVRFEQNCSFAYRVWF